MAFVQCRRAFVPRRRAYVGVAERTRTLLLVPQGGRSASDGRWSPFRGSRVIRLFRAVYGGLLSSGGRCGNCVTHILRGVCVSVCECVYVCITHVLLLLMLFLLLLPLYASRLTYIYIYIYVCVSD